ncbi:hypothetical protein FRB91_011444 [Serendipita sp. 411]|nr:hypothetical protein FRB91_011444 [Serendipita sp. 411]
MSNNPTAVNPPAAHCSQGVVDNNNYGIGMPSNPHPGYGIVNCNSNVSNNHHHHSHPHPTVSITVVSDFNCPWCYVAHKEVQSALTQARISHPNTLFTVEYRPFQLDPTLPTEKPMCRIACYKAKFGEEKMKKIGEALRERGRRVGIDFHMAGKVRQTTNAHRLALKAWLCGGEAAQVKMVDALFAAYFERETDIGCYNFLSKAAESTGLMTYDQVSLSFRHIFTWLNCTSIA